MTPTSETLRALAAEMVRYTHDQWEGTAISPAKIDAHADEWQAVENRLKEAEKDREWLIEWHRIWHRPGSLLRWAALTTHRLRVPKLLGVRLDMMPDGFAGKEKP